MTGRITAIVIAYGGEPAAFGRALDALGRQSTRPAQVVCVDQSPDGRFIAAMADSRRDVDWIRSAENLGYSSACNRAAERARGEYLFFLNPDAVAEPRCLATLADALEANRHAAIAGAQILLPDGRVNAGDNALHLSGLAWSGHYGEAPEHGPPRSAAVASGAGLLVRRQAFLALGGYTEGFFMYHDDVELAWRARLEGWEVLFCPEARVVHDYEFAKGGYKWRYMERNRWWCILAFYEARTLIALLPLLLAVEATVWLRARAEGWLPDKLAAWRLLWSDRRALRAARRTVQRSRVLSDHAILERMTAVVDSPFAASVAAERAAPLLRAYRRAVLTLTS